MDILIQLLIAGVSLGSIYGLVALAFLVIYNSTQIVNFAQGEMVMIGGMMAFLGLSLYNFSYISTFFIIVGTMIVIAFLFQNVLVNPLRKQNAPIFTIIIGTIAFGTISSEGMGLWLGKQEYGVPPIIPNNPINIGGVSILPQNLLIIIISWILVIAVWHFFHRTMTGLSLRAVSINAEGAKISGIKIKRMLLIGIMLSTVISGVGGMLVAPIIGASPYVGLSIAVKGFAAAILGGMGNIYAGMIGGLLIGISEAFFSFYIPSYAEAITYGIMLFMLVVKPTGLFPEHS